MPPQTKLFALGSNGSGQLGIGHQEDVSSPTRCIFDDFDLEDLDDNDMITKVVAGGNHTLVLFASGALFAAGSNEFGQCGVCDGRKQTSIFRRVRLKYGNVSEGIRDRIDTMRNVANEIMFDDVAATWEASFLTGAYQHLVIVCGRGSKGELGLGKGIVQATKKPEIIDLSPTIGLSTGPMYIKSCMSHTVVLTEDGQLIGWGAARKGQLGEEGRQEKIIWEPKKIAGFPIEAAKIALGRDFTFVAGEKERWHYLLGESKYEESYLPDLKTFGVMDRENENHYHDDYQLTASWSNIYALLPDGQLQGWGRNDRGQLPPNTLPKLRSVAAGSEHCLGMTVDGKVVVWGWGEHGNCGPNPDAKANVTNGWNTLLVDLAARDRVSGVGAGCATSFIIVEPLA